MVHKVANIAALTMAIATMLVVMAIVVAMATETTMAATIATDRMVITEEVTTNSLIQVSVA